MLSRCQALLGSFAVDSRDDVPKDKPASNTNTFRPSLSPPARQPCLRALRDHTILSDMSLRHSALGSPSQKTQYSLSYEDFGETAGRNAMRTDGPLLVSCLPAILISASALNAGSFGRAVWLRVQHQNPCNSNLHQATNKCS